jgi:hypothetical protein
MAPRWQFGWNYVARLRKKKERRGNHLLYAKAAEVSKAQPLAWGCPNLKVSPHGMREGRFPTAVDKIKEPARRMATGSVVGG